MFPFSAIGMGGASGPVAEDIGDHVANSLMLDSTAIQRLTRVFGAPTDAKIFTISLWVKRGGVSATSRVTVMGCNDTNYASFNIEFFSDVLLIGTWDGAWTVQLKTTQLFRDSTAFCHVLLVYDSTNSVSTDRCKLYVNGVRLSSFSASVYPSLNYDPLLNVSGKSIAIGSAGTTVQPFDGYLSAFHFIDGQARPPTDFGRTSASSGQWVPKTYAGTYGNNGFRLDFSNAASLGADSSGNANHWTLNGGITSANQYTDTPTNNCPIWNPLVAGDSETLLVVGNLTRNINASRFRARSSMPISPSGKWYWEVTAKNGMLCTGITTQQFGTGNTGTHWYAYDGTKWTGSAWAAYGAAFSTNDVIGIAVDIDNGALYFAKNGTWQAGGVPTSGAAKTGAAFTDITPANWLAQSTNDATSGVSDTINFGQRTFAYPPPSGFLPLNNSNLTAAAPNTSGAFTGNANANGPFVWTGGCPETLTINGNAVTWGTHADRLAGGFKIRTSASTYNIAGSNTWAATYLSGVRSAFKYQTAKPNP